MTSIRSKRFWLLGALAALLAAAVTACGGGGTSQAYETVAQGVLKAGDQVPTPRAAPVLRITGKIGVAGTSKVVQLDLATIEQLGLIRYSVDDPWLKREVSYTGVLLSDLVELLQPAAGATTMSLLALDDYEVEIAIADAERWPIMLATSLDGKRMPVANGGPTRIVFPYGLVDGIDELAYKDLWIWNIKSITVS